MKTGAIGKGYSLDARGKFARGGGFGRVSFGYNYFGFYSWLAGIYQLKHRRGKSFISRGKFNWGGNMHSVAQNARQDIFKNGVLSWHALTSNQKAVYNRRARNLCMSGWNLYLKEWLLDS